MRYQELKADKKKKQDQLDALEDAENLIEEAMGEGLKVFIGEVLIDVDEDVAT